MCAANQKKTNTTPGDPNSGATTSDTSAPKAGTTSGDPSTGKSGTTTGDLSKANPDTADPSNNTVFVDGGDVCGAQEGSKEGGGNLETEESDPLSDPLAYSAAQRTGLATNSNLFPLCKNH